MTKQQEHFSYYYEWLEKLRKSNALFLLTTRIQKRFLAQLGAGSWKLEAGWWLGASAGRISHTNLIQFSHHNIVKYLYGPSARRSCEGTGSFFECCLRQMPRKIQHAHKKSRIPWKTFQKLHFLYGIEIPLVFMEFSNFIEFS